MEWIFIYLTQLQGAVVRALGAELRAGGLGTMLLAFSLGAMHALTPGHGKIALVSYFLGQEARLSKGLRVALGAAFLHVVSGLIAFLVLRFLIMQGPSITGRASPSFTSFGYALLMIAGLVMIYQSWRPSRHDHGTKALTAGMGLLPCPLTISVLGFAWTQTSGIMVALVLVSLSLGIGFTFAFVALGAIVGRKAMGAAFAAYVPSLDRWARSMQAIAGGVIVAICTYMISSLFR